MSLSTIYFGINRRFKPLQRGGWNLTPQPAREQGGSAARFTETSALTPAKIQAMVEAAKERMTEEQLEAYRARLWRQFNGNGQ